MKGIIMNKNVENAAMQALIGCIGLLFLMIVGTVIFLLIKSTAFFFAFIGALVLLALLSWWVGSMLIKYTSIKKMIE